MHPQRAQWIEDLRGAPDRLAALAGRCPPGEIARKPAPDAFSAREVVHHLRDIEIEGHAARLARILEEPDPFLPGVNGDQLAIERRYNERPHEPALEEFRQARARAVAVLSGLKPEEWQRGGTLEGVGSITIEALAQIWRTHDREHLQEMARLVGA